MKCRVSSLLMVYALGPGKEALAWASPGGWGLIQCPSQRWRGRLSMPSEPIPEFRPGSPETPPETAAWPPVPPTLTPDTERLTASFPEESATLPPTGRAEERACVPERLVLPGYEVLGELGRGGMGVVYKAR